MSELPRTIAGLQAAISRGELSAAAAIDLQRRRLAGLDARYHAMVAPCSGQEALRFEGPLAGVGLAHKDIFDTAGRQPGLGLGAGKPQTGLRAAPVLQRLATSGATQLATLVMAEYACGATGANPHFAPCLNPLRASAAVGGSSSGSAVAVASGMVYGSLGTDTAGSVRMPAASCGILGLKTTQGLLPLEGVFPLAPSLDSVGVLARTAQDLLQILEAACEPGRLRPAADTPPRLAAWIPEASLGAEVADALHALARAEGMPIVVDIDSHAALTQRGEIVLHAEAARTHHAALRDGRLSPAVRAVALPGLALPPAWYAAAIADRGRALREFVERHLREHDILVVPALPEPLPDASAVTPGESGFDARRLLAMHRFMGFVNYLGLPSLVLPIAPDARGLPISAQLIGRPFGELSLLRHAARIAQRYFHPQASPPSLPTED